MLQGGTLLAEDAKEDIQAICNAVKADLEGKNGKSFDEFTAIQFRSQVVAGMNYFVKVHVGEEQFVHLRIYQALPHTGAGPALHSQQDGKTREEEIEYFG